MMMVFAWKSFKNLLAPVQAGIGHQSEISAIKVFPQSATIWIALYLLSGLPNSAQQRIRPEKTGNVLQQL